MSGLALLLLAAFGAAYGAWASLRTRPPLWAAALAAALFALAGILAVLASWIAGDGVVLPGRQLSPGLVAYYFSERQWERVPSAGRWLVLMAPLAHLLLVAARRDRAALLRPLPATALFVTLFLTTWEERVTVVQAPGPGKVAYLTVASRDDGLRLILAMGDPFDAFLRILHTHDTEGTPPELHVYWTNDGEGVVVRLHEESDPAFAVDLQGHVTGMLPAESREWTAPGAFVPPDVSRRLSQARLDVNKFIRAHRGLAPP